MLQLAAVFGAVAQSQPWPEADTECAVRQLAFSFGAELLSPAAASGGGGLAPSAETRLARSLGLSGGDRSGGRGACTTPLRGSDSGGSWGAAESVRRRGGGNKQWFVDARNGSDANSGGALGQAFRSLRRARAAVRSEVTGGNVVWIRGGTYWQAEPFRLGPADSGSEAAPNVWSAWKNETVVLSGGVLLAGLKWTACTSCGACGVWQASLADAAAPPSSSFNSLFVNGRREVRARYPDQGTNPTPAGLSPVDPATASSGYLVDDNAFAMQCLPTNAFALIPTINVVDTAGVLVSAGTDSPAGPRWPAGYCGLQGGYCGSDSQAQNISVEWPASTAEMKNDQDYWTGFVCGGQNGSSCAISRFDLRASPAPYWNSNQRPGITNWSKASNRSWQSPHTGILHQVHPAGWGSWQFQLAQRIKAAALQPTGAAAAAEALVFACKVLSGPDNGKIVPCPSTRVDKTRVNPCSESV
jgi:hypothetical protein